MKRVFAYIGFSMAITLVLLNLLNAQYCIFVLIGLVTVFVASLVLQKFRQAKVVPLSLGAALFACLLFCLNFNASVSPQLELKDQSIDTRLYLTSYPQKTKNNYVYKAKTEAISKVGAVQNINIKLYTDTYFEPYTELTGKLAYFNDSENGFLSYGDYADKIFLSAYCDNAKPTGVVKNSPLKYVKKLRNNISSSLNSIIGDNEGAFSAAIVTGDKSYISTEVKNWFKFSGTSHIMAVSGLHLSIILGFFLLLCKLVKLKDKIAYLLSIALALLYVALADFSGSVVRAGLMSLIMLIGKLVNKRADALNSLGIATAVMCINPYAVTDVGTMYSVLSVLSLVTIYPTMINRSKVSYVDPLDKQTVERIRAALQKPFAVLCAGGATVLINLPVSFVFFGYCSIVGPVANLVAMLFSAPCMVMSLLTYIASLLGFNPLTIIVATITKFFDMILISNARFFASFNGSVVNLDRSFGIVLCGAIFIIAYGFFSKSKRVLKISLVVSLCFLVVGTSVLNFVDSGYSKVYVTEGGAIVAKQNDKVVVAGVESFDDYYSVKNQLNLFKDTIDILVVNDEIYYSMLLCDNANVNMVLTNYFDDGILTNKNFNTLEVQDYYNISLEESFVLCYNQGNVTIDINGFSVSNFDMNCNAYIYDGRIYDQNGIIKLEDGSVAYTIDGKNTYKARRINQWQK